MSEEEEKGCFMLDIFGQRAHLNFKGKGVSKSNCGVCFTYLFIIFFFWSIFHTGRDIVFRQEPETVESEKFIDSPEKVELAPDTFNLAFGIQDPSTFEHYIDNSIYTAQAFLQVMERVQNPQTGEFTPTFSRKQLQLVPCRRSHLGARLGAKLEETMNIEKLLCIEFDPNDKLYIEGRFENKFFTHVSIEYSACDRTKANHSCADQTAIDAKLLGAYYAMYFTDQAIDPSNFDNPGQRFLNSRFTTVGKDYFKEYTTYVRPVKVTSDTGYLFSDESTLELLQFGKLQENSDFRKFPNFLKHTVRVDQITKFYTRRYIKLQDILSEVDGLITLAIIVLLVVIYPFIRMKFYQDLVNEVFDLKIYKPLEKSETITKFSKMSQKAIPLKHMRASGRASVLFRSSRESSVKKLSSKKGLASFSRKSSKFNFSKTTSKQNKSMQKCENLVTEEQNLMQQASYMPPNTTDRGLINQESEIDLNQKDYDQNFTKIISDGSVLEKKEPLQHQNSGGILKRRDYLAQIQENKPVIRVDKNWNAKQATKSELPMTQGEEKAKNAKDLDMPQTKFPYRTQTKTSVHFTENDKIETLKTEGDDQTMIAIPVSIDDFNVYNEKNNDLSNLNRQSSTGGGGVNLGLSESNQFDQIQMDSTDRQNKKPVIKPMEHMKEGADGEVANKNGAIQQDISQITSQKDESSSQQENDDDYADLDNDSDEADEELEDLIQNSLEPKRAKLDISLYDYIRSTFSRDTALKKKMEIFKEGERRIRERMDVFNIIMKLREIDKLKNILLDKNQLALFDNLPKPILDVKSRRVIEERTSTRFAALTQGNFIQRVKKDQIFKAVKAIMSKEEKTSVDEKLLDVYIDLLQ